MSSDRSVTSAYFLIMLSILGHLLYKNKTNIIKMLKFNKYLT